jgi:polar amino acid transport system permease protein
MLGAALPPVVMGWLAVTLAGLILSRAAGRIGRLAVIALAGLNGAIFAYLVLAAYLGFAAGVATSIRAAVLAYVLAVILALVWVGMMQLRLSRRTGAIFAGLIASCALAAAWQFTQPKASYVLVGSQSGTIGVVKDTPEGLISAMKYGTFPGAAADGFKLKSFSSGADAMADLETGSGITAALVPQSSELPAKPVLWQIAALADGNRMAGTAFAVVAILLGLLLAGGLAHHRHPLSVGAEFVVDTIRGIPMLVIVLYIGLPLAGAVKDASGGFIDPPNLLRGIIAMALAYSAYLAEIFRAGINAVPVGQIEAARSLGLTRWQTARNVILPQAFRIIIPPLGNEFIAILKDTSLLSILSIRDITQRMREFQSASFLPFAPYNSAAIFYVLLTLVAASLVASIERKYHIARR